MSNDLRSIAAKDYCEKYPDYGNRTLARKLCEDYPLLFDSVEGARSIVRTLRGASGEGKRQWAKFEKPLGVAGEYKFSMPESLMSTKDVEPYYLDDVNWLVISDLHIPYHDTDAIMAALGYRDDFGGIFINGDLLDFHRLSTFTTDYRKASVMQEIAKGRQFLSYLRERFPNALIVNKAGNHDKRYQLYLARTATELQDVDLLSLENLLGLEDLGIDYVSDLRKVMSGDLMKLHGHELAKGIAAPVNPARGVFLKTGVNTLVGHHHKTSHHVQPSAHQRTISCWSTGCLCDLHPAYNPYGPINLGFAFVDRHGPRFKVSNLMIVDGEIC